MVKSGGVPARAEERHQRAVEQTARWAQEAADAGSHDDALCWLDVLEVVDGVLPAELILLRAQCLEILSGRTRPMRSPRMRHVSGEAA